MRGPLADARGTVNVRRGVEVSKLVLEEVGVTFVGSSHLQTNALS
jgi:hypothetical protein